MQILLKFAANIDKDLGHLSRLAGPCALSLGSGHPKTLKGTFFPHKYPSQSLEKAMKVTEVVSLKGCKILEI